MGKLGKLYEFDLAFFDDIAALKVDIRSIPSPSDGGVENAVGPIQSRLEAMESRWNERRVLVGSVVESSS